MAAPSNPTGDDPLRRYIPVTSRNLWFLEKSLPLFGMLDFFPPDSIGAPNFSKERGSAGVRKLTIETDQGWSFQTDIASDQKIFRNSARSRGTGKWVRQADLKPGDRIVIEKLGEYTYRLAKESPDDSA